MLDFKRSEKRDGAWTSRNERGSSATRSVLALVFALTGVISCGGPGKEAEVEEAIPVELEQLCDVYVESLCSYWVGCIESGFVDQAHCESQAPCAGVEALQSSVAAGRVAYDAEAAGKCRARAAADSCEFESLAFFSDVFRFLDECGDVLTPQTAAGASCIAPSECTSHVCDREGDACPGRCTAFSEEGGSCAGWDDCAEGLRCDTSGICRPPAQAGDACDEGICEAEGRVFGAAFYETRPELYCDIPTNTCRPPADQGQPCGTFTDGTSEWRVPCAEGWCETPTSPGIGVCAPLSQLGGRCTVFSGCIDGLQCQGGDLLNGVYGTCVPPTSAGQPCEFETLCADGLRCINGVCDPGGVLLGEPCSEDISCLESRCVDGICERYQRVGEPCSDSDECYGSDCQGGICVDVYDCAF